MQRALPLSIVALLSLGFGCSAEVLLGAVAGSSSGVGVTTGSSGTGGSATASSSAGGCAPKPSTPPPKVAVADVETAAFYGDVLHVQGTVNGEARYAVLKMDAPGVAHVVTTSEELSGPANLAPVQSGLGARLRMDSGGHAHAELVDVSSPEAPKLAFARTLDGLTADALPNAPLVPVFSFANDHLYACLTAQGAGDRSLVAVPLVSGSFVDPSVTDDSLCNRDIWEHDRFAARGDVWATWIVPTGSEVDYYAGSAEVYRTTPQGVLHPGDYGYNQTGVHHYGDVVLAFTDGTRALFDPENDSEVFLYDALDQPQAEFAHAYFSLPGPKHVLGLEAGVAYVATQAELRAYDVTDIQSVKLTSLAASLPFDGKDARLVAASSSRLALVDAHGRLYVVEQDAPVVRELEVFASAPPPPVCGD